MPPLDLQHLAAGARLLRRLPDRPHGHADGADDRFLQRQSSSRTTRTRRRSPMASMSATTSTASKHRSPKDGATLAKEPGTSFRTVTGGRNEEEISRTRRRPDLHGQPTRPGRRGTGSDPAGDQDLPDSCSPKSSPAGPKSRRRWSSPRPTCMPTTS